MSDKKDDLTPGITAVLDQLANGREIDGRSWRSLDAAQRRGLVEVVGGKPRLTSAGQGALGLAVPRPDGPDDVDGWMDDHRARRLERPAAEIGSAWDDAAAQVRAEDISAPPPSAVQLGDQMHAAAADIIRHARAGIASSDLAKAEHFAEMGKLLSSIDRMLLVAVAGQFAIVIASNTDAP